MDGGATRLRGLLARRGGGDALHLHLPGGSGEVGARSTRRFRRAVVPAVPRGAHPLTAALTHPPPHSYEGSALPHTAHTAVPESYRLVCQRRGEVHPYSPGRLPLREKLA